MPRRRSPREGGRRSIRLRGWNYTNPGDYFVTVNVQGKRCLFGRVVGDECVLSAVGRIVEEELLALGRLDPMIRLGKHVVMPNHVHFIISYAVPGRRSLGNLVGQWKMRTTVRVAALRGTRGERLWQRDFYERVLRTPREYFRAGAYIDRNPRRWAQDRWNPDWSGVPSVAPWDDETLDEPEVS